MVVTSRHQSGLGLSASADAHWSYRVVIPGDVSGWWSCLDLASSFFPFELYYVDVRISEEFRGQGIDICADVETIEL